jgi:hypothetical protein
MKTMIICVGTCFIALTGCVEGNMIGVGATYENSDDIVKIKMTDGKSLECLSGPWKNTIWYDRGVLRAIDGNLVAQSSSNQRAIDHACREYFTAISRGESPRNAAGIAMALLDRPA